MISIILKWLTSWIRMSLICPVKWIQFWNQLNELGQSIMTSDRLWVRWVWQKQQEFIHLTNRSILLAVTDKFYRGNQGEWPSIIMKLFHKQRTKKKDLCTVDRLYRNTTAVDSSGTPLRRFFIQMECVHRWRHFGFCSIRMRHFGDIRRHSAL